MPQEETTPVLPKPARGGSVGGEPLGNRVRVGIVGCGALVAHGYLPAFSHVQPASPHFLLDPAVDRVRELARRWNVPRVGSELEEAIDEIDAAIVAAPNHLHGTLASRLLRAGVPVLVEKPMAMNVAECDRMLAAAHEGNASIAVGFVCRFSRAARFAKELLLGGVLGPVRSFQAENGVVFGWPVASDYLFRRDKAGGGVLIDLGSHLLDLLTWWLGPLSEVEHWDDSFGGVEANSFTCLTMESGVCGSVRLSRTCQLRQRVLIECEHGTVWVQLDRPALKIRLKKSGLFLDGDLRETVKADAPAETFVDLLAAQVTSWADSVLAGRKPEVDGYAGRAVSALIERCYSARQPWHLPWMIPNPSIPPVSNDS